MSISSSIFVVAEMACSHEGKISLARKIIDTAGRAGADAIQFQIWEVEDIVVPDHSDYSLLEKLKLRFEEWQLLAQYVRHTFPNLKIFACPYAADRIPYTEAIGVDGYKIHSSEITNYALIDAINQTAKRVHLCTGAVSLVELDHALARLDRCNEVVVMHGHQSFPTVPSQAGLNLMPRLGQRYQLPYGYQDHSPGNESSAFYLPAAAVGLGAQVIEKHLTHDRSFAGVDHEAALDGKDFEQFVAMIRTLEQAAPSSESERALALANYRRRGEKKWVAKKDILAGTPFSEHLFARLRSPSPGITTADLKTFEGKTIQRNLRPFETLFDSDIF